MNESNFLKKILLDYSQRGFRLFRNNSGRAYIGHAVKTVREPEFIKMYPGDVLVKQARILHAGLGTGSPDLVGWVEVVVTPDMVGKKIAVFAGIEAKTGNVRMTKEQEAWQTAIKNAGGIAEVVRE